MDLKKIDFTRPSTILKLIGLALAAIIVAVFAILLISYSIKSVTTENYSMGGLSSSSEFGIESVGESTGMSKDSAYDLSVRNVQSNQPVAPGETTTVAGNTAEQFEVTSYNVTLETRKLDNDCAKVAALKEREDVIFERSNFSDHYCSFVFKVEKSKAAGVLDELKAMEPKELTENNYTIKKQVEDFTSREEVLKQKLAAIDETLDKAIGAYNQVTDLATKVSDVASLAKVIDSKINLIERLTEQRLTISTQLESLSRAKAEQLDRLEYTYFNVGVKENKFIDGQALKDSWKAAIKNFVSNVNKAAQNISIKLLAVLLVIFEVLIYGFIILFVAKYAWKLAKYIWKK